jgi:hypothetical protein
MIDQTSLSRKLSDIISALPLPSGLHVEGVYLAGSYASRTATSRSDVDIYAITRSPRIWRKFYNFDGVDIDLFVLSLITVKQAIARRQPVLLTSLAEAAIIMDSEDLMLQGLQKQVRAAVQRGPATLSDFDGKSVAHRFATIIEDCEDCAVSNPEAAIMLMIGALKQLSELYLNSMGLWDASHRRTFDAIKKVNAAHAELFSRVAAESGSATERLEAFKRIVDVALQPYGGTVRYFESPILDASRRVARR